MKFWRINVEKYLKNNLRVLSVRVIPCCETLKCTWVGVGSGRWLNKYETALRTACGPICITIKFVKNTNIRYKNIFLPVRDSVSTEIR